jgi:predicted DNA-binding transcriptional regulator AlpA
MMENMRVLSFKDLATLGIRYSRPHLRRLMLEGKFPRGFALSAYRRVWREAEIFDWLQQRATAAEMVVPKSQAVVRGRRRGAPPVPATKRRALPPLVE